MILDLIVVPGSAAFVLFSAPVLYVLRSVYYMIRSIFPEKISGAVVIITGASGGLGEAIAYEYAKRGANLMLSGRRHENLHHVAQRAKSLGAPQVEAIRGDLSTEQDCKQLIDLTLSKFGRLDHLCLNAGLGQDFLIEEAADKDASKYTKIVDVNFWANVMPAHFALPYLKQTKGRIIVSTSVAAFVPYARQSIFNAAKGALMNFYETLRVEVGPAVKITVAVPGWIDNKKSPGAYVTAFGEVETTTKSGLLPPLEPEAAARAIVKGALQDRMYVFTPYWEVAFMFWRVFAIDFVEALIRLGLITAPAVNQVTESVQSAYQATLDTADKTYHNAVDTANYAYNATVDTAAKTYESPSGAAQKGLQNVSDVAQSAYQKMVTPLGGTPDFLQRKAQ